MVRTKGFTFYCPFLAIEPSLLLSFSSSSSRLLRVLVVIGANREKTQQESSKRSKLEHDWRGVTLGTQTSGMPPLLAGQSGRESGGPRYQQDHPPRRACPFQKSRAGTKISFRLSPPPYRSRPRARARYRFLTALAAIGCLDQKP